MLLRGRGLHLLLPLLLRREVALLLLQRGELRLCLLLLQPCLHVAPQPVDELLVDYLAVSVCVQRSHHSLRVLLAEAETQPINCLAKLVHADAVGTILVHRIKERAWVLELLPEQRPLALDCVQHHLDDARLLRLTPLLGTLLLALLLSDLLAVIERAVASLTAALHDSVRHRRLVRTCGLLLLAGSYKGRRELLVADLLVLVLIQQGQDLVQLDLGQLHVKALQRQAQLIDLDGAAPILVDGYGTARAQHSAVSTA